MVWVNSLDNFGRPLDSDTVICKHCAAKYLKELAYKYRHDIPSDELPGQVVCRVLTNIYQLFVYLLSVCLSVCPSVCLYMYVCIFTHVSVLTSVCLSQCVVICSVLQFYFVPLCLVDHLSLYSCCYH